MAKIGKKERIKDCRVPHIFVGNSCNHDKDFYCMYNPKKEERCDFVHMNALPETGLPRRLVWTKSLCHQVQDYRNKKWEWIEQIPWRRPRCGCDAGCWKREKKSVVKNEITSDLSITSWHSARARSGIISMSNAAAEINNYTLSAEIDQEEIESCEFGLVGEGLGGGFNHINKLHVIK